jgi:hypothetical protein
MTNESQRVHIDLNRKLMTHDIIRQIRDTATSQGMLAGSAVLGVLDEYDKMRYLLEGLVTAYERNDEQGTIKVIEVLRTVL